MHTGQGFCWGIGGFITCDIKVIMVISYSFFVLMVR